MSYKGIIIVYMTLSVLTVVCHIFLGTSIDRIIGNIALLAFACSLWFVTKYKQEGKQKS